MSRILGIISGIISRLFGGRRPPPSRWQWGYRCEFIDQSTGDVIATTWRVVETDSPTNYQRASAIARREAWANISTYVSVQMVASGNVRLKCRRRGPIIGLP